MKEVSKYISEESAKEDFLASFSDKFKSDFLPEHWSEEQKNEAVAITDKKTTKAALLTAIPMVCRGPKCQFAKNCPLQQQERAPIGHGCPYEFAIVKNLMEDYVAELQVDSESIVEMIQVRDLVDYEVQLHRATKLLAQEDFIQENCIGVDQDGDPIMKKELNLAIDYKDKINKWRQTAFKNFIMTRDAKMKHEAALMNSAEGMSALMRDFGKTQRAKEEALKLKLGIIDTDDYIEAKTKELEAAKEQDE